MDFNKKIYDNISFAVIEAICTFGNNEGKFSKELNNYYNAFRNSIAKDEKDNAVSNYMSSFKEFAVVFKIVRNINSDSKKREQLLHIIFEEYLPSLSVYNPASVDIYSEKVSELGLTYGKLTSAFSKIAFLYKPEIYFPYDKTARESIKSYMDESGMRVSISRSYTNYNKIVNNSFKDLTKEYDIKNYIEDKEYMSNNNINEKLFYKRYDNLYRYCEILEINDVAEFILRRAFDKSLMLFGGFKMENLVAFKDNILI